MTLISLSPCRISTSLSGIESVGNRGDCSWCRSREGNEPCMVSRSNSPITGIVSCRRYGSKGKERNPSLHRQLCLHSEKSPSPVRIQRKARGDQPLPEGAGLPAFPTARPLRSTPTKLQDRDVHASTSRVCRTEEARRQRMARTCTCLI